MEPNKSESAGQIREISTPVAELLRAQLKALGSESDAGPAAAALETGRGFREGGGQLEGKTDVDKPPTNIMEIYYQLKMAEQELNPAQRPLEIPPVSVSEEPRGPRGGVVDMVQPGTVGQSSGSASEIESKAERTIHEVRCSGVDPEISSLLGPDGPLDGSDLLHELDRRNSSSATQRELTSGARRKIPAVPAQRLSTSPGTPSRSPSPGLLPPAEPGSPVDRRSPLLSRRTTLETAEDIRTPQEDGPSEDKRNPFKGNKVM